MGATLNQILANMPNVPRQNQFQRGPSRPTCQVCGKRHERFADCRPTGRFQKEAAEFAKAFKRRVKR